MRGERGRTKNRDSRSRPFLFMEGHCGRAGGKHDPKRSGQDGSYCGEMRGKGQTETAGSVGPPSNMMIIITGRVICFLGLKRRLDLDGATTLQQTLP